MANDNLEIGDVVSTSTGFDIGIVVDFDKNNKPIVYERKLYNNVDPCVIGNSETYWYKTGAKDSIDDWFNYIYLDVPKDICL